MLNRFLFELKKYAINSGANTDRFSRNLHNNTSETYRKFIQTNFLFYLTFFVFYSSLFTSDKKLLK